MKFQMPEKLDGLDLDAISKLLAEATAEAHELNAIADDKISAEESAELIKLIGHMDVLAGREDELKAEAAPTAEELAAARARLAAPAEEVVVEDPAAAAEVVAEAEAVVAEAEAEKEAVVASATKPTPRRSFAAKVAETAPEPEADPVDEARSRSLSITASANIKGFESGAQINGFDELAKAYVARGQAFAGGGTRGRAGRKSIKKGSYAGVQLSPQAQRFSVASLTKPENEFTIEEKDSAERQYEVIMAAAKEQRLGGGSLVAAGGWCAPSEQVYGFLELETADGLLSVPEINARRGGIQFTKGPQLGDLLLEANLGFIQTEAEAEAGEVKPVFDIECPDWDDVRMDAAGYAIRAGLLTNAAYPELIRRYLGLGLIVHARRMNALTIARIAAAITQTSTFAPVGTPAGVYSATSDVLAAVELGALRIREQYSMALNATVEGVFPIWLHAVIRSELSRRTGVELINVTDQMITAWFAARKVNAQFVRDYQSINSGVATAAGGTAGWTRFPDKVEFLLYPAGAFVKLATDVIDLDTVYDTDDLTQNQFMAAFFEEGFGIANTGGSGVKMTVGLNNVNGVTGAAHIGATLVA
jgi:hypothetical protein